MITPKEPVPEEIIQPPEIRKRKYPKITPTSRSHKTITITTTYKKKKSRIPKGDFIEAPPESPIDLIEQRLRENQKQREQKLKEQLKPF